MSAAIALVAGLVGVGANRAILAVTDGPDLVGRYAELDQEILGGGGAAVAEAEIVLSRAALIAVPFQHHGEAGIGGENALEQVGIGCQSPAGVIADVALVVIEVSILRFAPQHIRARNFGWRRRLWRRRRR